MSEVRQACRTREVAGAFIKMFLWVPLLTTIQIRIYGMTHFNENAEYWGDQMKPIIGAANGRFTARSVKIFGDGNVLFAT